MRTFESLCLALGTAAILSAAQSITGIFNAASWAPSGMTNGDIAQGSIFTVTGSDLGPATLIAAGSYPLSTTQGLGGTTIQVGVGSQGFDCIMVYSSSNQVAAILPSRTLVGTGTLNLTYQGSRVTFPIKVVAASFATFTGNQRGNGPGIFTDTSFHLKSPVNPAHPGDVLVAWGTGLGGTTGDETMAPPQVDLKTGAEVFVGGKPSTVLYGGRGSSPGLDQINFMVPEGVSGCFVSVVVRVRGVIGNFTTAPVAPPGQAVCSDNLAGFAASDFMKFQAAGTLRTANIALQQTAGGQSQAVATFDKLDSSSLIGSRGLDGWPSPGNCIVLELLTDGSTSIGAPIVASGLDAGAALGVTGGSMQARMSLPQQSRGFYFATSPAALQPGGYTVSGFGGADVGSFSASVTIPATFQWTNMSSSVFVPRGQDLLITWSGGGSGDAVAIFGVATLPAGPGSGIQVPMIQFLCTERASAGQFSVPSLVLTSFPNTAYAQGNLGMTLAVSDVPFASFSAPGVDVGFMEGFNFVSALAALQ
jgi:uncharacterized protein (TIGR03437 family)